MTRLKALFLVASLALPVSACKDNSQVSGSSAVAPKTTKPTTTTTPRAAGGNSTVGTDNSGQDVLYSTTTTAAGTSMATGGTSGSGGLVPSSSPETCTICKSAACKTCVNNMEKKRLELGYAVVYYDHATISRQSAQTCYLEAPNANQLNGTEPGAGGLDVGMTFPCSCDCRDFPDTAAENQDFALPNSQ